MHRLSVGVVCAVSALSLWIAASPEGVGAQDAGASAADTPADLSRGAELFDLCTYCHGPDGLGNPDVGAPAIAGLPQWYVSAQLEKFRSGLRGLHPDDLAGMRMRPMALTLHQNADVDDFEDVAAYTASLPRKKPEMLLEGGNAAAGAPLYAVCTACHGPDAQGNEALGSPPLTHTGDWYLADQLRKFQNGIRGGRPGDTFGAQMAGMANVLQGEQAIKDVIAHIMTLSK